MPTWTVLVVLGAPLAYFVRRTFDRRAELRAAAAASGLAPITGLGHLPASLQRTALWPLSDGGFERRVVHGTLSRGAHDLEVTAFDFETLRERRGEWAFLPVDRPFRIGGQITVVVCEVDRTFPHVLLKRDGEGDELRDDGVLDRGTNVARTVRDRLGMAASYPAELPATLRPEALDLELPAGWRAYGTELEPLATYLAAGLATSLARTGRRDLVIELLGRLIVVYPAAHDAPGSDAFGDLTETALALAVGVLASSPSSSPRGVEPVRTS